MPGRPGTPPIGSRPPFADHAGAAGASPAGRIEGCLGVDFGGVIVPRSGDADDTSFFGARPLDTPAAPGSLEVLAYLLAYRFADRIFIVSKASPRVEALTRAWMRHVGFHPRTGISEANLVFVRERLAKAEVCRTYGITHFVDDRVDILEAMSSVSHRYLFAPSDDPRTYSGLSPGVTVVRTWDELGRTLDDGNPAERRADP